MPKHIIKQDDIIDAVSKKIDELKKIKIECKEILKNSPKGELRVTKCRNHYRYYCRNSRSKTKYIYLSKNKIELARNLAEKNYIQKISKEINSEISALSHVISKYHPDRLKNIYQILNEGRKSLVEPIIMPDDVFIEQWINNEYIHKSFDKDAPPYFTMRGERVRSKSEMIIADKLYQYGVPYRYEYPTSIEGYGTFYPDFLCLNIRTQKEYIWEHFGMMENVSYAANAINKINLYENNGYYIGENFIITFESSSIPLNSILLERKIKKYLI